MSELHLLVVFDTETKGFRVSDLSEMPVDPDESVWEPETEEWRGLTDAEADAYSEVCDLVEVAVANINAEEVNRALTGPYDKDGICVSCGVAETDRDRLLSFGADITEEVS